MHAWLTWYNSLFSIVKPVDFPSTLLQMASITFGYLLFLFVIAAVGVGCVCCVIRAIGACRKKPREVPDDDSQFTKSFVNHKYEGGLRERLNTSYA